MIALVFAAVFLVAVIAGFVVGMHRRRPVDDVDAQLARILEPYARRASLRVIQGGRD